MATLVAFSGGKDSTAMAYRMAELGSEFSLLFTPTGNELPGVAEHVQATAKVLGKPLIVPPGPTLATLIETFGALPNNRQRWCTRMIKIEPCRAYLLANPGSTLCVGLRADEEERQGMYGGQASYRFPLREWGWGIGDVLGYLNEKGIAVPPRTDCALCYDQRLGDWKNLLRQYPEEYAKGEALEDATGHTFRSPTRDTWPAGLRAMRLEFERGRKVRGEDDDCEKTACRVCRL
jgi:3'-phosphoadenosine 5'-phosphosulfate sulfotransferase (PAPS reductase)/FAD synthetase